jgi:hypothetical protein
MSDARNAREDEAFASMEVREGCLNGYTSSAYADKEIATASQEANGIDYAAFIEASNGVYHQVKKENFPAIVNELYGADAYMTLRDGGLSRYSSSSTIDGASARASQSFSSDYSKYIEGWTGAFNEYFNEDNSTWSSSSTNANIEANDGDLYWTSESSSDINSANIAQYAGANYAKNIRSHICAGNAYGTYLRNDTEINSNIGDNSAYADDEANEGGLNTRGHASASEDGTEAHHWISSDYAKHISSETGAYKGNGFLNCTNNSCCYWIRPNVQANTNIEVTEEGGVRFGGDAYSTGSSVIASESTVCCGGITYAKAINIKAAASYLDDLGNWTRRENETNITNGGLASLKAYSSMDANVTEIGTWQ